MRLTVLSPALICAALFAVKAVAAATMLDPSFGAAGQVLINAAQTSAGEDGVDVLVQPDGKVVVIGSRFSLVRYGNDGSLDA